MSQDLAGNLKGLAPLEIKSLTKLFSRRLNKESIVSLDLAREMLTLATRISRQIGIIATRDGKVVEVIVGTKEILYLPDLGRYRLG